METKRIKSFVISLRKTAYTVAIAAIFVAGVSYMQAVFIYPTVPPPGTNVPTPVNLSSTFQDKAGGFEASSIGVTNGINLNGVNRTTAMGWPISDVMAQCHLESRRVDSIAPRRFYTTNATQIAAGQYPKCDDYLTPEARTAGWAHSGGDECVGWDSNDCQAVGTVSASCVYTRIVCTNGITVTPQVTATSTYVSMPFAVPGLQCVDGVDNEPLDFLTKLASPAVLPSAAGIGASFSQNSLYAAISGGGSPVVSIYKRTTPSSITFTKLPNLSPVPPGSGLSVAFAPNNQFLAVGTDAPPFVTVYSQSGDTFTKLTDPPAPTAQGRGLAWSSDSTRLAVAHSGTPFITVYSRSGNTFTKLPDVTGGLPASDSSGVSFSPDGIYLAVGFNTTPYLHVYKWNGTTYAKLASPSGANLPTGPVWGVSFATTSRGLYLASSHSASPWITINKMATLDTFTKMTVTGTLPNGNGLGTHFSPDGTYVAVAHDNAPWVSVYKRTNDTFAKLATPVSPSIPTGIGYGASFSTENTFLLIAHDASPFISIFKFAADGLIDYPADPECGSTYDNTESSVEACSDGLDNEPDGFTDYPADSGCTSAWDTTE